MACSCHNSDLLAFYRQRIRERADQYPYRCVGNFRDVAGVQVRIKDVAVSRGNSGRFLGNDQMYDRDIHFSSHVAPSLSGVGSLRNDCRRCIFCDGWVVWSGIVQILLGRMAGVSTGNGKGRASQPRPQPQTRQDPEAHKHR